MAMRVPPPPEQPKPAVSRGSRGSRGSKEGNIFAIAPSEIEGLNVIWRDRPLLIWEGAIVKVEIIDAETEDLLWSQEVSPEKRWVTYEGESLQPGQSYEWRLCDRYGDLLTKQAVTFQVLAAEERERIAAALAEKEVALKAEEDSPEAIALERAAYFAEQGLWADVLMEAFSVNNPSADLMELLIALSSPN